MFEITEVAGDKLKELTKDREDPSIIRVALMEGG